MWKYDGISNLLLPIVLLVGFNLLCQLFCFFYCFGGFAALRSKSARPQKSFQIWILINITQMFSFVLFKVKELKETQCNKPHIFKIPSHMYSIMCSINKAISGIKKLSSWTNQKCHMINDHKNRKRNVGFEVCGDLFFRAIKSMMMNK